MWFKGKSLKKNNKSRVEEKFKTPEEKREIQSGRNNDRTCLYLLATNNAFFFRRPPVPSHGVETTNTKEERTRRRRSRKLNFVSTRHRKKGHLVSLSDHA